jgi:hypothetical protein
LMTIRRSSVWCHAHIVRAIHVRAALVSDVEAVSTGAAWYFCWSPLHARLVPGHELKDRAKKMLR